MGSVAHWLLGAKVMGHIANEQDQPLEPFASADEAARFLSIERRELLAMARRGIRGAYPLDPTRRRKTWVFLKSELAAAIKGGI